MDPEIRELWERYRDSPAPDLREQLILQYAPLVKYVAGRLGARMPSHVEQSDLVSYGMFGLIDAIEKFDVEKGFKFETYAISRVKGAIIDELRSIDWVPRSVRRKARRIEEAMRRLEARFQRTPSDEELAKELGVSQSELEDMLTQVSLTNLVALDDTLDSTADETIQVVDTIEDDRIDTPESSIEQIDTREQLAAAISRLSEREQTVLGLYYFEGMTLAQIGEILGVTESRICQIHAKSVMSLRTKLTEHAT